MSAKVSQLEAELKVRSGNKLQQEQLRLERDAENMKKLLAEREQELRDALEREQQANDKNTRMSNQHSSADSQLVVLQQELDNGHRSIEQLCNQVDVLRKQVADLNTEVAGKTHELAAAKQLATKQQAAQQKYEDVSRRLEVAQTSLAVYARDATRGKTLDEYKMRIQELERECTTLRLNERANQEKLAEVKMQLSEAQTKVLNLERTVAEMNSELNRMKVRWLAMPA